MPIHLSQLCTSVATTPLEQWHYSWWSFDLHAILIKNRLTNHYQIQFLGSCCASITSSSLLVKCLRHIEINGKGAVLMPAFLNFFYKPSGSITLVPFDTFNFCYWKFAILHSMGEMKQTTACVFFEGLLWKNKLRTKIRSGYIKYPSWKIKINQFN